MPILARSHRLYPVRGKGISHLFESLNEHQLLYARVRTTGDEGRTMPQQLPPHPNLEHLKKQAKDVLQVFRRHKPQWKLADAQRAVARGYGFTNWPSLKTHVEKIRHKQWPTLPASARALNSRADFPAHPIAGAWFTNEVRLSSNGDPRISNQDSVIEFQVNGEEIKLTQVATDPTGQQIAITTTMWADGREHPVPFGEGTRLKALWATPLTLEAAFTRSEQTVSTWSYEVSPDGKSLAISTANDRIVFKRFRS